MADENIIIVGAGIFGLSTAIHLAQRGYRNVKVFDKQPYDESRYSYFNGADAASADTNKIIRSAYGDVSIYQDLSLEAIEAWKEWNREIANAELVPPGMKTSDRVFLPNGNLSMTDSKQLSRFDLATIKNSKPGTQLLITDPEHRRLAVVMEFEFAIDPFVRERRGHANVAVLDTTGGTAVADKACRFALHKARKLGVQSTFGSEAGKFESLLYNESTPDTVVSGIRTSDGVEHRARLVIMACGGWTPSLVHNLDDLCETTAGSVAFIKIPPSSQLWDRFSPERFPTWQYKMRDGAEGGLYGFARDEDGWLKIGYRGTKYTNPLQFPDGKVRSVPVTRWSEGETLASIPRKALEIIQGFIDQHLPELAEEGLGISTTRLCWYNDSFDNHLVVDWVPGVKNVFVATGGSGHAFKYLPVLGQYVVDVLESQELERPLLQAWRWRKQSEMEKPYNRIMEGASSSRALQNNPLVPEKGLRKQPYLSKL